MLQLNNLFPELLWQIFSVNNMINCDDNARDHFFSALYVREQGRKLSLVSRKFRPIGQALVWHNLELNNCAATDEEDKSEKRKIDSVLSLLRTNEGERLGKYIRILNISAEEKEGSGFGPGSAVVIANPNRLKPVGYDWVEGVLQHCPNLEHFGIRSTILANPIVILHFLSILKNQTLQYLRFWIPFDNLNVQFLPIDQQSLMKALSNVPRLKSLHIICNRTILPISLLNIAGVRFTLTFTQFITAFLSSNYRTILQDFVLFLPSATFLCLLDIPLSSITSLGLEKGSSNEPSLFCEQVTILLPKFQFLQELSLTSNDLNVIDSKEVSALLGKLPKTLTYFKTDLFRSTESAIKTFWSTSRCPALTEFIVVDLANNSRIDVIPSLKGEL